VNINMSLNGVTFATATPKIDFNYTDNVATASCTLYFNNTLKATNAAVNNNTQTILTASSTANGNYQAIINCSDGTNTGQSNAVNMTVLLADSCTYGGSGDWNIVCSDNCVLATATDLLGNNITITGSGTTTIAAVISNWRRVTWYNTCRLNLRTGGRLG
jgi:hypothetical protein